MYHLVGGGLCFGAVFLWLRCVWFFGRFICLLVVAGLGFRYLVARSSERLGHPFKNPFRMAFNREDILGLHIAWCPNFTVLARVRTECMNMATDANSCTAGVIFHTLVMFCILIIFHTLVIFCTSPSLWEVHSCL